VGIEEVEALKRRRMIVPRSRPLADSDVRAIPAATGAAGRYATGPCRDRYGRLRALVTIDSKGPFKLIVDTAANGSAVTFAVATSLGLGWDLARSVVMHGAVGSVQTPVIRIQSLALDGIRIPAEVLPIVSEDLAGADGFLGLAGLPKHRVTVDFSCNRVSLLEHSFLNRGQRESITLAMGLTRSRLPMMDLSMVGISTKVIVATGLPQTIGNRALYGALERARALPRETASQHRGRRPKSAAQSSVSLPLPALTLGSCHILGIRAHIEDATLFRHEDLLAVPSILLGIDVLGQFESLCLDYTKGAVEIWPKPANSALRSRC
jgi:hypothetical protein